MNPGHDDLTPDQPDALPDPSDAAADRPGSFPAHVEPLHHQVAGHVYDKKKHKLGFLGCGDGTILKPLQSGGRGESELSLYRSVFHPACTSPTLLQLRGLVPNYLGTYTLPDQPGETYLHLEDMTAGMVRPCVADIKLGRCTYDPLAGPEKIAREEAKYPPAKKLGFQFRGMRVYDAASDSFTTFGKEYLRSFDENTVEQAFIKFFTNNGSLRKDAVKACLDELQPVLAWFSHQTRLSFYASSLLVVYEGHRDLPTPHTAHTASSSQCNGIPSAGPRVSPSQSEAASIKDSAVEISQNSGQNGGQISPQNCGQNGDQNGGQISPQNGGHISPQNGGQNGDQNGAQISPQNGGHQVSSSQSNGVSVEEGKTAESCRAVVRLIDFAHVFPIDHVDENNLHGVETVIELFKKILDK